MRYEARDDERLCACGLPMVRQMHTPHAVPDGVYSFAPNLGNADAFEKRREAMKRGQKVMEKTG